jgi:hypothetical protein
MVSCASVLRYPPPLLLNSAKIAPVVGRRRANTPVDRFVTGHLELTDVERQLRLFGLCARRPRTPVCDQRGSIACWCVGHGFAFFGPGLSRAGQTPSCSPAGGRRIGRNPYMSTYWARQARHGQAGVRRVHAFRPRPSSASRTTRSPRRSLTAWSVSGSGRSPRSPSQLRLTALGQRGAHRADLASQGHNGTTVTKKVYRHQICPVIEHGAMAMDQIFGDPAA